MSAASPASARVVQRPSTTRIALALLAGARGEALATPVLLGAAELLGMSENAMRIALSRLLASGDVSSPGRGLYLLSAERSAASAHVRTYRTGFLPRVAWQGAFCAVLTSHLPRRSTSAVRRREAALSLSGFREYRPGVFVRPDNLEGGRLVLAAHLARLGLESDADVVGLQLEASHLRELERLYELARDARRARALCEKVLQLLDGLASMPRRKVAASTFFLGDEVLRFLARDPLLPESMADPAPRRALASAMGQLDERAYALWRVILDELAQQSSRVSLSAPRRQSV